MHDSAELEFAHAAEVVDNEHDFIFARALQYTIISTGPSGRVRVLQTCDWSPSHPLSESSLLELNNMSSSLFVKSFKLGTGDILAAPLLLWIPIPISTSLSLRCDSAEVAVPGTCVCSSPTPTVARRDAADLRTGRTITRTAAGHLNGVALLYLWWRLSKIRHANLVR